MRNALAAPRCRSSARIPSRRSAPPMTDPFRRHVPAPHPRGPDRALRRSLDTTRRRLERSGSAKALVLDGERVRIYTAARHSLQALRWRRAACRGHVSGPAKSGDHTPLAEQARGRPRGGRRDASATSRSGSLKGTEPDAAQARLGLGQGLATSHAASSPSLSATSEGWSGTPGERGDARPVPGERTDATRQLGQVDDANDVAGRRTPRRGDRRRDSAKRATQGTPRSTSCFSACRSRESKIRRRPSRAATTTGRSRRSRGR